MKKSQLRSVIKKNNLDIYIEDKWLDGYIVMGAAEELDKLRKHANLKSISIGFCYNSNRHSLLCEGLK